MKKRHSLLALGNTERKQNLLSKKMMRARASQYGAFTEIRGKYSCPVCCNSIIQKIVDLRIDFKQCAVCGYMNDVDEWDVTKSGTRSRQKV